MKKILLLPLLLLLISCEPNFTYDYYTVDDGMLRVIDFSFEKTELAPGDTAVLYATFAGFTDSVSTANLNWRASWNIITNPVGSNVIVDDVPLSVITEEVVDSTDHTKVIRLTFKVPDSVLYHSEGIPENWGDMFKYIDKSINPAELGLPATKTEMLSFIELAAANKELINNGGLKPEMVDAMSQLFSVIFKIEAVPAHGDKILDSYNRKVFHSVRYHSRFDDVAGVYQNSAPRFDSLKLYRLQKGTTISDDLVFDGSAIKSVHYLQNDTIRVPNDPDASYLLMIHPSERDVTISLEQALLTSLSDSGTASLGGEYYDLYAFDRTDKGSFRLGASYDTEEGFMSFFGYDIAVSQNEGLKPSTVWFRIDDGDDDVSHRPRGSVMQEVTFVFEE